MKIEDRDSVCRLCLCYNGSFLDIFLVNDCFGHLVADAIAELLQVEVSKTDIFPNVICVPCFKKIVEFEDFKKKCLQSKDKFSEEFVNAQENEGSEEIIGDTTVDQDQLLEVHSYAKSIWKQGSESSSVTSGAQNVPYLNQEVKDAEVITLDLASEIVIPAEVTKFDEGSQLESSSCDTLTKSKEETVMAVIEGVLQERTSKEKDMNQDDDDEDVDEEEDIDEFEDEESEEGDLMWDEKDLLSDAEEEDEDLDEEDGSGDEESDDSDLDIELDCSLLLDQKKKVYYSRPPIRAITEGDPLNCKECGKSYSSKQSLLRHQKNHSIIKTYPCKVCEETFTSKEEYNSHRNVHFKEKRYFCETCGKGYAQKKSLEYHINSHLGLKPFYCDLCGKGFVSKKGLEDHMRIHRDEKPYICEICGKPFRQKSHLWSHLSVHSDETPHKCHLCNKGFKSRKHQLNHLSSHLNERKFICKDCGKAFNTSTRLKIHTNNVHPEGEPLSCETCGKKFACKRYLRVHRSTHAKKPKKIRIRRKKEQVIEVHGIDLFQDTL